MALFSSVYQYFTSFIPGERLVDGGDCLNLVKQLLNPTTNITALAGGGATGATQLQYGWNQVATATSGGTDSVMAPPAVPGTIFMVNNAGGYAVQLFGQQANQAGAAAGDKIIAHNSDSGAAVGTGISLADTSTSIFFCFTAGLWKQLLGS